MDVQPSSTQAVPSVSSGDVQDEHSQRLKATQSCLLGSLLARLPRWLQPSQTQPAPPASPLEPPNPHTPFELSEKPKTVFYLAYGSNLSAQAFRGRRGIKPLGEINVCVPTLQLTFDLPGIPYLEPCFANSAHRDPDSEATSISYSKSAIQQPLQLTLSEKTTLLPLPSPTSSAPLNIPDYHKNRWHKPLVGVLYELTPADFAHVIATEGGGASYQDVEVPCYQLPHGATTVPMHPVTPPIIAHTLFAPTEPPSDTSPSRRLHRPDPNYAQSSSRYLKLIHDGAAEHSLPQEYRDYLAQIRPYRKAALKQRIGAVIFAGVWVPLAMLFWSVQSLVTDKNGKTPKWMVRALGYMFSAMWISYDNFFRKWFGDGERTFGE